MAPPESRAQINSGRGRAALRPVDPPGSGGTCVPALAGGFSTIEPPGKPSLSV